MNIEHTSWYSPRTGKEMNVMRYGHFGPPMIYFPTSGGNYTEFDYYRMQDNVWPWTEAGKIQFFVVDGFSRYSWYKRDCHPRERLEGHMAYESFVIDEVIPHVLRTAQNDDIGGMGFSFGAYYAINMLMKYPNIFKMAMAIGGTYDIRAHLDGYYDRDVYFNNPMDYVPNLDDPWYLNQIGHTSQIVLMLGASDKFKESTYDFHHVLNMKGIPHVLDVWPAPCDHHEFWWKKQVPHFLGWAYR